MVLHLDPRPNELPSLESLFKCYYSKIYCYTLRFVRNPTIAEDITSDVFLKLVENYDHLRNEGLCSWLLKVARNCVINHYNKYSNKFEISLDGLVDFEKGVDYEQSMSPRKYDVLRDVESAERRSFIDSVFSRLSDKFRGVAALYYLDDLTIYDISDRLCLPVNTVLTRLHRARREMIKDKDMQIALVA
jgi:RNA polymerase sigma-70 factor (ECF subfamily)